MPEIIEGKTLEVGEETKVGEDDATSKAHSKITSKTYISNLQSQLDEEKQARLKLENELQQLRSISLNIQETLNKQQREKWKQGKKSICKVIRKAKKGI